MEYFRGVFKQKLALFLDIDGFLFSKRNSLLGKDKNLEDILKEVVTREEPSFALITSHQINYIDKFLRLPQLAISGNYGTELRLSNSNNILRQAPPLPTMLVLSLDSICQEFGCVLEDRSETASLHATNEAAFLAAKNDIQDLLVRDFPGYALQVQGKSIHILNVLCSKSTGIGELLKHEKFLKRDVIYMGDVVHLNREVLPKNLKYMHPRSLQDIEEVLATENTSEKSARTFLQRLSFS